jgi:hypothetical protein
MRVSIIEDIQKIREANLALDESIRLEKVTYEDASRNIESLLKRCKYIEDWLSEFGQKSATALECDLLSAKLKQAELTEENARLISAEAALKKMHANRLAQKNREIEELKSTIRALEDRITGLSKNAGMAWGKLKKSDAARLRYRSGLPHKSNNPSKRPKKRT